MMLMMMAQRTPSFSSRDSFRFNQTPGQEQEQSPTFPFCSHSFIFICIIYVAIKRNRKQYEIIFEFEIF